MKPNTTCNLFPELQEYVKGLFEEFNLIPSERKVLLQQLSQYILDRLQKNEPVHLNFICTHNSRRSHLSQIWAATAAAWYGLQHIHTYSGGTEATAFNPRAVAAMQRAGFHIQNPGGSNPRYLVVYGASCPPLQCWSKTFDDAVNPSRDFAAIMTCSEADTNCPFIPGADFRLPLTYIDPKEADDTPQEARRYDERVRQIGRELFYALELVQINTKANV